ncbi:hypothetical protein WME76_02150 [Sorangium sp. So ce119]|uniref:hypothetical protein n=1 Tax=Sorangium sp. So ce119 TaxID=3133279 RepID=UPI003F629024
MLARYAVVLGVEREQRETGRYLLERLVARVPVGSFEGELLARWADVIEDSPRCVWHAAEAFAVWARELSPELAARAGLFDAVEAAKLFERAALYGCVQLEWSSARRAELRRGGAR